MARFSATAAALVAILQAVPVVAGQFTANQRKEIVQIVREALKSDPSILRDAVEAARRYRRD